MARSSEDDREAVDRAFADLVAEYHRTAGTEDGYRPDEPGPVPEPTDLRPNPDPAWADEHPLFHFESEPAPPEDEIEVEERFVPEPLPPLPRPAWPVLLAWVALSYTVVAVLAVAVGVHLPTWAGWLAVLGFVGGLAILVFRLPRHRPPDAGDGAVL